VKTWIGHLLAIAAVWAAVPVIVHWLTIEQFWHLTLIMSEIRLLTLVIAFWVRSRDAARADTPLFACPDCGAAADYPTEALMHCDKVPCHKPIVLL
jgi:hypothetical protein